jgi:signal transduction histidine kinase
LIDYILFESTPGIRIALLPDMPKFTIVAVTNDLLTNFDIDKKETIGKGLFELFDKHLDFSDALERSLNASINYTIQKKSPHQFSLSQCEISLKFENATQKDWSIRNMPVLNPLGELEYVIQGWEATALIESSDKQEIQSNDIDRSHKIFMAAPIVIGVVKGDNYVIELANDDLLQIWGRTPEVIGSPLLEAIPELQGQGFIELLNEVRRTGESYQAKEAPIKLVRNGREQLLYMNFIYKAFYENASDKIANGVIAIGYDVTEQVLARRQAEESQQELELAVEIADLGTFKIDLLANKAFSSEKVNEWFAISEQGYPLELAFAAIHVEDRKHVEEVIADSLKSETNSRHDVTYRVIHPINGKIKHLRSFGKTVFNEEGRAHLIFGIIQDITEQSLHQRQLEENEALLQERVKERTEDLNNQKVFIRSILDAALNGIYALRAVRNEERKIIDFCYLFANTVIAKQLNTTAEQIIGSSMLELLPENRDNGFFDLFCKLLETGQIYRGETHFVVKNIDSWFDYSIVPIDTETVVVSIMDVSEKKQSVKKIEEQRNLLDNILQNSSNGISVSQVFRNSDGKVIDALTILANDAAVKYIGLPREIYLSKKATEIEPAVMDSPYYQACIETLETGQPFVMQYYMQSTKRWLELTVSKLDYDHLIQIFTDVTPIKEAQLQLEKSVEELKRSNQNLEQFAYAASHDLKEPMRKIRLFSDRLRERLEEKLEEEHRHYFNRISQATDRMNMLIDDLLIYSSVSSGSILNEDVSLEDIVKMVLEDLELEIEESKANIKVGALPTVKGHRRQLQQLFQNLIGNAIKYKKQEMTTEVSISSRLIKDEEQGKIPLTVFIENNDYYLIEITDNGIGFEAKDAERIFDVFTRLHGNTEYKGTGVGLSIVRKVAENHGGYIWAESNPGEGAIFKLLLPVLKKS